MKITPEELNTFTKPKWLKKKPNSIQDCWAIMEEAKIMYELSKRAKRVQNKAYEDELLKSGVFVGTKVKTISNDLITKDKLFEVLAIRRNIVTVRELESKEKWRLRNYKFRVIK